MKPDIRLDAGYKKRPDIRYNPIYLSIYLKWSIKIDSDLDTSAYNFINIISTLTWVAP